MTPICNIQIQSKKPCRLTLPPESDTSLGAELKRKRLSLEWTQKETAEHFKVLKDSYQKWEWNQGKPHVKNMKKVVEFLGYNYWDDGTKSLSNLSLLFRIEHKLSQVDLSNIIGLSPRSIERIEAKKQHVSKELKKQVLDFISSQ